MNFFKINQFANKKHPWSKWACIFILLIFVGYRGAYSGLGGKQELKLTTWDAFGYYMYLPGTFIYHDMAQLKWVSEIDSNYELTGGRLYQANISENGNYVTKYLGGIAIMQAPFFAVAHLIALNTHFPADGFSAPYQWSLAIGALLYTFLALFGLRKILLHFFNDRAVALSLFAIFLASNLIQYSAIEAAQSHIYILLLYVLILYFTMQWYKQPKLIWAILGGLVIGLATICRPTEALMVLIPILWNTHNAEARKTRRELLLKHKKHIVFAAIFGFIGVLPQLIYWKIIADTWVYNVGSKWTFLNPWFRVLFGFTNGWFVYTPIAIFFVLGLFFVRKFSFRNAVIYFGLLNIWVIISWFDWRYGATYSTRALVQSYPIFALGLTALVQQIIKTKWRFVLAPLIFYLAAVNLLQITQYNSRILIPNEITPYYYQGVYLDPSPSPLDMARLDTHEELPNYTYYSEDTLYFSDSFSLIHLESNGAGPIAKTQLDNSQDGRWLSIQAQIEIDSQFNYGFINAEVYGSDTVKYARVRLMNPLTRKGKVNNYAFHIHIPHTLEAHSIHIYATSDNEHLGTLHKVLISQFNEE